METTIMGYMSPEPFKPGELMENQMEKNMQNEMETGIV